MRKNLTRSHRSVARAVRRLTDSARAENARAARNAAVSLVQFDGENSRRRRLFGGFDVLHFGRTSLQILAGIEIPGGRKIEGAKLNLVVTLSVQRQTLSAG